MRARSIRSATRLSVTCSLLPVTSLIPSWGNISLKRASIGAMTYWAMVELAPSLSSPSTTPRSSLISSSSSLLQAISFIAFCFSASPSLVRLICPRSLLKRVSWNSFSSSLICFETAGCEIYSSCAAFVKLSLSATARNTLYRNILLQFIYFAKIQFS